MSLWLDGPVGDRELIDQIEIADALLDQLLRESRIEF